MVIQVDSREKPHAIVGILEDFDRAGITHFRKKLNVGDYIRTDNPLVIVDRKQDLNELAKNATSDHDRFKRELLRLDQMGGRMIVLTGQDRYKDISGEYRKVNGIDDLMFWRNPFGSIDGIKVFRVLSAWESLHNVSFEFCRSEDVGRRIIEILYQSENGCPSNLHSAR